MVMGTKVVFSGGWLMNVCVLHLSDTIFEVLETLWKFLL